MAREGANSAFHVIESYSVYHILFSILFQLFDQVKEKVSFGTLCV